jgi:hypothetical protein
MAAILILRKVTGHLQATDAYRVVYDGMEVGSIGLQTDAHQREYWAWGIDTVLPRQSFATQGEARDQDEAMRLFRATWEVFASDPERLADFIEMKRISKNRPFR